MTNVPTFIPVYDIEGYLFYININMIEAIIDQGERIIVVNSIEYKLDKNSFELLFNNVNFIEIETED